MSITSPGLSLKNVVGASVSSLTKAAAGSVFVMAGTGLAALVAGAAYSVYQNGTGAQILNKAYAGHCHSFTGSYFPENWKSYNFCHYLIDSFDSFSPDEQIKMALLAVPVAVLVSTVAFQLLTVGSKLLERSWFGFYESV